MSALTAVLNLERDLLSRARHAAVLDAAREPERSMLPQASLTAPPRVASSAAAPPMQAAQEAAALASGPVPVGELSSGRLRSIVAGARQNRGPHRARWENRERLAWAELNRRGQAA